MAEQCTHWNDRLPDGTPLMPVRCLGAASHDGAHYGGGANWNDACGIWGDDATSLVLCPDCQHPVSQHSEPAGCMDSMNPRWVGEDDLGFCVCQRTHSAVTSPAVVPDDDTAGPVGSA